MKKSLKLVLILSVFIFSLGCTRQEDKLSLKAIKEKDLDFTIEKITLSKGFQNIEEEISSSKKDQGIRLFLSLGIVDCSTVNVREIRQRGKDVDIYIEKVTGEDSTLAVPQIVVNLEDKTIDNHQEINYRIVGENYEPIALKFNKSDIIKKVSSQFNISPINLPLVQLYKKGDRILWDIDFYSAIDKKSPSRELVNLFALVDANSGKVLESMDDTISSRLFDGELLDYRPGKTLLIKDSYRREGQDYTDLYSYNESSKERTSLFTSRGDILSASLSPDGKYIAFIEDLGQSTSLYTIAIESKLATRVNPLENVNPRLIKWAENQQLYILDNDNDLSEIHLYDIGTNTNKSVFKGDFSLADFDIKGDKMILLKSSNRINKDIYYQDKERELVKVSFGSKASFLNENTLVLLEGSENSDINKLFKYSIEEEEERVISNTSIKNFQILDDNNIIYSSKDGVYNNYLVYNYSLDEDKTRPIFHMIDDNIFLNPEENYSYISLSTTEDVNDKYIYQVYLDKLQVED